MKTSYLNEVFLNKEDAVKILKNNLEEEIERLKKEYNKLLENE